MTTLTTQGSFVNTTDATFRDWIARTISMLTTIGLVRTSDTGQIDPATITKPAVTGTMVGYATFRFDDPMQATRPIFLRIDFGSGTTSGTAPAMRITLAKGTDGAGGLTGVLFVGSPGYGSTTTVSDWRASKGSGYVALCPAATGNPGYCVPFFLVERSPDGTSVLVVTPPTSDQRYPDATVIAYDAVAATTGIAPVIVPYRVAGVVLASGTPLAAASLGPVFPWVFFPPAQAPWQSRAFISYPGGDAPGSIFKVTLEGQDRDYMPIPISNGYSAFGTALDSSSNNSRAIGLAIRWE